MHQHDIVRSAATRLVSAATHPFLLSPFAAACAISRTACLSASLAACCGSGDRAAASQDWPPPLVACKYPKFVNLALSPFTDAFQTQLYIWALSTVKFVTCMQLICTVVVLQDPSLKQIQEHISDDPLKCRAFGFRGGHLFHCSTVLRLLGFVANLTTLAD